MLNFLDIFFIVFHSLIIIFNLFGWLWKKTRRANLLLLIITGLSWFVLGIWYGIGYCPLTDWHWQVLKGLGDNNLPNSYVKYLLDRVTGADFSSDLVDATVVIGYFLALGASLFTNFRNR